MPTKAKNAEVGILADAMLRELETHRQQGAEVYPPTLRQLAARTEGSPTDELVQKAAKSTFTAKAIVTEKVDRKPSLDAYVYFKGDEPKKPKSAKAAPTKKPKPDVARTCGSISWPRSPG